MGKAPHPRGFFWAPRSKGRGLCPHVKGSCTQNSLWPAVSAEDLQGASKRACQRVWFSSRFACRCCRRPAESIACSKKLVRGERPQAGPCASQPTGDKKDGTWQQFMGRKADWIIHCRDHVAQQRWHWAAQKPLPSEQHELKAGHLPGGRHPAPTPWGGQRAGPASWRQADRRGPGEGREGGVSEKCLRRWPNRPRPTPGSSFWKAGEGGPGHGAGQLPSAGLRPGARLGRDPPHSPSSQCSPLCPAFHQLPLRLRS